MTDRVTVIAFTIKLNTGCENARRLIGDGRHIGLRLWGFANNHNRVCKTVGSDEHIWTSYTWKLALFTHEGPRLLRFPWIFFIDSAEICKTPPGKRTRITFCGCNWQNINAHLFSDAFKTSPASVQAYY